MSLEEGSFIFLKKEKSMEKCRKGKEGEFGGWKLHRSFQRSKREKGEGGISLYLLLPSSP